MLKLAELLSLAGLNITFLNTEHNHERLTRFTDVEARFANKPIFKQLLVETRPPINCIIGDGGFHLDLAIEPGIPIIRFRTVSASCFWTYFCVPDMIEACELPIKAFEFDN
ncbi:hypothetical protein GH714_036519 [Hevea brasiliensis]|uniref:Uncharacterized protein n=1 Tax=Hevea brasiliensis TaxID=3981 RepID=A0A6A6L475_HEVBR|nr:hypothetical protein GH714_036519 [Hevea brasiliensis]